MSRIIVKNLPKKLKDERLKKLFTEKGELTDCALKYTKDGIFRRFAFLGYKTAEEAKAAVKHFDGTFIGTSKIQVDIARDLGDTLKPRAWSKYSKDSSSYKKLHENEFPDTSEDKKSHKKENKADELIGELKDDKKFQEFLEAHKSRANRSLWDDDAVAKQTSSKKPENLKSETKIKSEGSAGKGSDTSGSSDTSEDETDSVEGEESNKTANKSISDLDFLKSKVVKNKLVREESDEESNEDSDEDDSDNDSDVSMDSDESKSSENEPQSKPDQEKSNQDQVEQFRYIIKMKGLPSAIKELQIVEFFKPLSPKNIQIPRGIKGKSDSRVASVEFSNEKDAGQAMRRHKNFISQKKIFLDKVKEVVTVPSVKPRPWETKISEDSEEIESIDESGRLYVRNLAYCCEEDNLEELFRKFGPLTEVHLPIDSFTKKVKGFAFITYMIPEHAVKAYTDLDGTVFQGRMLHILPAKAKKDPGMEITDSMSFKQKKAVKQRQQANSSHNWNTLFLGANAVADVMAEKYGTSKDEILSANDRHSVGVRMALGETQVVAETRQFLIDNGVVLDSFSQADIQRSKTVILVKNLPASTKAKELEELFGRFGTLGRIILPPSGVTGLIEFVQPTEARAAFKGLAYTKFQHIPLYLEWAPVGVFSTPTAEKSTTASPISNEDIKEEKPSKSSEVPCGSKSEKDTEDTKEPTVGSTLFVKNLNFETTEESFEEHFKKCGIITKVTIAKKKDPKNTGKLLAMGYGFVEFAKQKSADKALKRLQNSTLDEHQLNLKISHRDVMSTKTSAATKRQDPSKEQKSTKILVRNIPFEAKQEEVRELFTVFGELKFVRLPKKMTGSGTHRGFGFVDFLTKEDAKRAFNALCHSTHLYGRRLVLEWADSEETVEQLRQKTADHYHDEPAKKKFKKSMLMDELKKTETLET